DGKSRAAYHGFAREHVRRKRDARMIHDGWLSDPVFRIDITRNWRGTRCRTGPTAPPGECTRVPGSGPRTSISSILTTAMHPMAQFFLKAFQWHGVKRGDAFAFYAG